MDLDDARIRKIKEVLLKYWLYEYNLEEMLDSLPAGTTAFHIKTALRAMKKEMK